MENNQNTNIKTYKHMTNPCNKWFIHLTARPGRTAKFLRPTRMPSGWEPTGSQCHSRQ